MEVMEDAENWMQNMQNILRNRRLIDIRMPGTHHSDSHPFGGHIPVASYVDRKLSKCQGCTIEFQLMNGVRHLDMRPGTYKGEIRSVHGPSWLARGSATEGHLDQIVRFIETHPKEFVVLTMESTSAAELTDALKHKLRDMLLAKFKPYMVTVQDSLPLATVTMGQLWDLDRRIMVIVESPLLPEISDAKNVYDKQGLYNWSWEFSKGVSKDGLEEVKLMRAKAKGKTGYVPNVLDLATALMTTQIQETQISNRTFFAASLYNDPFGPGWFFGKLTSPIPWGPQTFAKRCSKRRDLHTWYNRLLDENHENFRINIIDVDFCENDLRFINVIINSNARYKPLGVAMENGIEPMAATKDDTAVQNTTETNIDSHTHSAIQDAEGKLALNEAESVSSTSANNASEAIDRNAAVGDTQHIEGESDERLSNDRGRDTAGIAGRADDQTSTSCTGDAQNNTTTRNDQATSTRSTGCGSGRDENESTTATYEEGGSGEGPRASTIDEDRIRGNYDSAPFTRGIGVQPVVSGLELSAGAERARSESVGTSYDM